MPTPSPKAPDLVRGLRAGRRDAFERLYGEYHATTTHDGGSTSGSHDGGFGD